MPFVKRYQKILFVNENKNDFIHIFNNWYESIFLVYIRMK